MNDNTNSLPTKERGITLPNGLHLSVYALTMIVLIMLGSVIPLISMALAPHYHSTVYEKPYAQVQDFELYHTDGSPFHPSELQGQIVIYYFGYTQCPDICPTTLFELKNAMIELGPKAEQVEVVFVTIDPENDNPELIEDYLSYFNESFIGLYGTIEQLDPVLEQFDIQVSRASEGDQLALGTTVTHSGSMVAVDKEGNIRLRIHHGGDPENLAQDIRYLLRGW